MKKTSSALAGALAACGVVASPLTAHAAVAPCIAQGPLYACVHPLDTPPRGYLLQPVNDPPYRDVAAYLDRYYFRVGPASFTVSCVTLATDATVSPCSQAGLTYGGRVGTLVDVPVGQPDVAFAPSPVWVCNATLDLTVDGTGVTGYPIVTLCAP
jgi:hypothetical protein